MSTEIAIPDPQSRRPESARPMRPGTARRTSRRTSLFKQGVEVFFENRLAVVGFVTLLIIVVLCFIGPSIWRTDQVHTCLLYTSPSPRD